MLIKYFRVIKFAKRSVNNSFQNVLFITYYRVRRITLKKLNIASLLIHVDMSLTLYTMKNVRVFRLNPHLF